MIRATILHCSVVKALMKSHWLLFCTTPKAKSLYSNFFNVSQLMHYKFRPVASGGAGGALGPPVFGQTINPISTRGGADYAHHSNTSTPRFSDLATALIMRKLLKLPRISDKLRNLIKQKKMDKTGFDCANH